MVDNFPMDMDRTACYRAIWIRDVRFDGRLFVGVKTTSVYCWHAQPALSGKTDERKAA
jgi:AraC family transcriptional regulator of adaptative response / DNA-3-methyladenine glycosylase II